MIIHSSFRQLDEEGIKEFIAIGGKAYPFMNILTMEDLQKQVDRYVKIQTEDPAAKLYGAYRDGKMVGGMQLQDFVMNFNGMKLRAGGVGFVAVDLLHKKERIAKDIVSYFIDHYRQQKVAIAMLYPFRPDFYKQMGFGYGTKMNQYRIKPSTLPKHEIKENLSYLTEQDKEQVIECYNRFADKTHGMIERTNIEINNVFAPGKHTIVYKKDGNMEGFLSFFFKKASEVNVLKNDIVVREFIYHSLEAFHQLLNFLHTQFDQINRIVLNTQDEYFHYLLNDPRDGSDNNFAPIYEQSNLQGIGLMYRIIDTSEFFRQLGDYSFNNQDITVRFNIADSFIEGNDKPVLVQFKQGKPIVLKEGNYDVEISMDVSNFSAMAMGCVDFAALLRLGIAKISEEKYADCMTSLFKTKDKPFCTTTF